MFANDILKHYRGKFNKDGFVDVTDDIIDEEFLNSMLGRVSKLKLKCGTFYKKKGEYGSIKAQMDAEVLLCQIYHKLGFKTAVYVPAQSDFSRFILSNDINAENVVPAFEYHFNLIYDHQDLNGTADCLFSEKDNAYASLFNPNVLRKRTEMFITDASTMNYDRVDCNYYYLLNKKTGKPADLVLIDYSASGENFNHAIECGRHSTHSNACGSQQGLNSRNIQFLREHYQSDFDVVRISREKMIEQAKNCKALEGIFNAQEFANRLGSVNVNSVAKDIKKEINYELNQKYVDTIDKRFEETAEMLMR